MSATNKSPYRLDVVQPVCARCKHRADAKMMDDERPDLDWFCLATTKELWRAEYNPLTGITTPAKMGHNRCKEINGEGQCTMFEASRRRPKPPPQIEPAKNTSPWWRRIFGGRS